MIFGNAFPVILINFVIKLKLHVFLDNVVQIEDAKNHGGLFFFTSANIALLFVNC